MDYFYGFYAPFSMERSNYCVDLYHTPNLFLQQLKNEHLSTYNEDTNFTCSKRKNLSDIIRLYVNLKYQTTFFIIQLMKPGLCFTKIHVNSFYVKLLNLQVSIMSVHINYPYLCPYESVLGFWVKNSSNSSKYYSEIYLPGELFAIFHSSLAIIFVTPISDI
jgi:hypothetical protein